MEFLISFLKYLVTAMPAGLLYTLPLLLGGLIARSLYRDVKERCLECEKKTEGLRSKLAQAQRSHLEVEAKIDGVVASSR